MKNIIDSVIPSNQSKTKARVIQMIPILVRWAKSGLKNQTYGDMFRELGVEHYSGIGNALGYIEDVIEELRQETGKKDIPTLNTLCKSSTTMLPSYGFSYVFPNYKKLKPSEKKVISDGLDAKTCSYKNWDWVLKELGLKPAPILTREQLSELSKPIYGGGGEGEEHKAIKEYICKHPESIGYKKVKTAETEYVLPSGDRLDVYFELEDGTHVAIEVKPSISPEQDLVRGIFQCVKYKAVMEALRAVECADYNVDVLLVAAKKLSPLNQSLAKELGVEYKDKFSMS